MNRLAVRIGRADLETTARVLEELCRRLEADDAQDTPGPAEEEEEETMRTPPEPPKRIQTSSGGPRSQR